MFQQKIEKAPKLIEFQRLTLCFLYPEPIMHPASNNIQEKTRAKKISGLICVVFLLISKNSLYFNIFCLSVAY